MGAAEEETKPGRDELRQETIKQLIILGFAVVTLVIYTVGQRRMSEPDFAQEVVAKLGLVKQGGRDREKEALRQVQREISWMEHGVPESYRPEWGGIYG